MVSIGEASEAEEVRVSFRAAVEICCIGGLGARMPPLRAGDRMRLSGDVQGGRRESRLVKGK